MRAHTKWKHLKAPIPDFYQEGEQKYKNLICQRHAKIKKNTLKDNKL